MCSNELSTEASRISLMKPLDKIYLIFSPRCVTYRQGERVMGGSIFNYDNFSSLLIKFIGIFQFECIYITVCTGEFSAGWFLIWSNHHCALNESWFELTTNRNDSQDNASIIIYEYLLQSLHRTRNATTTPATACGDTAVRRITFQKPFTDRFYSTFHFWQSLDWLGN